MQTYEQTTAQEKRQIKENAQRWIHNHDKHVLSVMKESFNTVAPSGSDMYKPELWKGIHWRWFFRMYPVLEPQEPKKPWMDFKNPWKKV